MHYMNRRSLWFKHCNFHVIQYSIISTMLLKSARILSACSRSVLLRSAIGRTNMIYKYAVVVIFTD